ncbi:hypothetical protein M8J77_007049 [Diaphorina citri]|nr:hypothetical protein M8J77_007049 [Diaphorina citri]
MGEKILKLPYYLKENQLELEDICACGSFSIDSDCLYHNDCSNLKYLYPPYLKSQTLDEPFDLNQDYDKIVPKMSEGASDLSNIMAWLRGNPEKAQVDFVTFRGTYSGIMIGSLVENKIDWRLGACRINNTIYLCQFDTELKKKNIQEQKADPQLVRSSQWGYKFEQFMLTEDPSVKPRCQGELNENKQFCVMFQAKLKHFKLLYGAEMDGVISETKIEPDKLPGELKNVEFVELKTGKPYGLKMLKWWAQSYFVGIKNIICGEKDGNEVKSLKQIYVDNILRTINFKGRKITESNCCNLVADILQFIQNRVFGSDEGTYWLFEWHPQDKLKIRASITQNPEYKFLDEDFVSFMKSQPSVQRDMDSQPRKYMKTSHDSEHRGRERHQEGERWHRRNRQDY